jgi:hypothetical protein
MLSLNAPPGAMFAPLQDPVARAEVSHGLAAGAVDIILSGHVSAIDHGNVCGLLTGWLQHVCFTALHILAFVVLLLTLAFFDRRFL